MDLRFKTIQTFYGKRGLSRRRFDLQLTLCKYGKSIYLAGGCSGRINILALKLHPCCCRNWKCTHSLAYGEKFTVYLYYAIYKLSFIIMIITTLRFISYTHHHLGSFSPSSPVWPNRGVPYTTVTMLIALGGLNLCIHF